MKNAICGVAVLVMTIGYLSSVDSQVLYASDRAYSTTTTQERSGNWSRSTTDTSAKKPAKKSGAKKSASTSSDVPLPRAKPGSKAAKAEAAALKAEAVAKAKKAAKTKEADTKVKEAKAAKPDKKQETSVPAPRKKEAPKKTVEAGLAPSAGDTSNTSAPYRGNLDNSEVKKVLSDKVLESRVDGNAARITLAEDGTLSWTSSAGNGQGRWWTENGRICDRFDPSGSFPGRGTGCRSFEQKADGYYAGGRKLKFLN